jgi:NADPH-dependent 2,4-dienoyl-CoA reductase/sulfur reductase-like enzyme
MPLDVRHHVVVVGASLAGTMLADSLRLNGFDGRITLLGEELHGAYNRPALSKGVLAGTETPADILLQPLDAGIDQRLGVSVADVDLTGKSVLLADGERIAFDALALTTGARARRLADAGLADPGAQEITIRDVGDAVRLSQRLRAGARVVIVGGGILGMELASACLDRGAEVTVVSQRQPLLGQLGSYLATMVARIALERGVRFAQHPSVRLRGMGHPVVELGDGRRIEGDIIVSAVGCAPNIDLLADSEISASAGVPVDDRCRVSADVVAAGDVAAFPASGRHRRTPLWNSGIEQARTAALALLQGDAAPALIPTRYFWTDQFGLAIKACGQLPVSGEPIVLDENPEKGSLLLQWGDRHGPTAAVALNRVVPIGRLRALSRAA